MSELSKVVRLNLFSLLVSLFVSIQVIQPVNAAVSSQSICFGGSQSRYFEYPAGEKIGTSSFTLEMWVKPNTWSAYMAFLNTGYGNGGGSYLGYNTDTGPTKIIFYNGETIGSNGLGTDAQQKVPTGVWSHVAFVRDQATTKNYFYINGIKVNEGASANYNFTRSQLDIGGSFDGCMTSVRLAKSALYSANFTPAALGSFSITPDGTSVLVALTASGDTLSNTGTSGSIKGTGTITYESIKSSSRTLVFTTTSYSLKYGDTQTVIANVSAGSGPISYSAGASTACTVNSTSGVVTITSGTGTCSISGTSAEDDDYVETTTNTPVTITVGKVTQTPITLTVSPTNKKGIAPFTQQLITLSASGGTDTGTVTYSIKSGGTASGCALSNANTNSVDTITATSSGTCLLQAVKAATNNYATETSTVATFSFSFAQTFAYDSGTATSGTTPTGGTYYAGDTFTVSTGSSLSKPGFKLNGWKNNSNVSYAAGSTFTVSTADTLTAQWRQASLFGIADADLTEVQNWNVINGFSAGGNIGNGTDTFTVTVPANALTAGTAVKLYALSSSALAQSKIGAGNTYILNMVVAWLYGQTVPTATSAVTLRIESPSIKKDAVAYMIIGDTVTAVGTATQDGVINTYFTEDPVITVVNPVVQNNNGGGGGGGGGNSNTVVIVEKPIEIVEPVVISKPTSPRLITMSTKVYFGLNASWINSLNIKSVKEFISRISLQASIKEVTIQGFTQPTVINPNPLGLSKARANSVAKLVKGLGVTSKVVAVGKGNEKRNLPTSRYVLVTVTGEAKS